MSEQPPRTVDKYERVGFGERWLADAFEIWDIPAGFIHSQVDMTRALAAAEAWQARGVKVTVTTLVVRATALALAPLRGHFLQAGYRRLLPAGVDIGLSVAGSTNYAPVAVVRGAEQLDMPALAEALKSAVTAARDDETRTLASLRRWGWLVPFALVRKWLLRTLFRSLGARRKLSGTFQITSVPADAATVFQFVSPSVLAVGKLADRVIAVDGAPAVRKTLVLSLTIDHRALDGVAALEILGAIQKTLEDATLLVPPAGA